MECNNIPIIFYIIQKSQTKGIMFIIFVKDHLTVFINFAMNGILIF